MVDRVSIDDAAVGELSIRDATSPKQLKLLKSQRTASSGLLIAADEGRTSEDATPFGTVPCGPFLFGPENATLAMATQPIVKPAAYNPVFLYGPTGVGKTHLLCLIVERFQLEHPDQVAQYVTASDFARAMTVAKELDTVSDFRQKYRGCQLLAMDDLQELSGKPAAQTELLHTLDEMIRAGQHLYVSCRRTLAEFTGLLPALKSRLAGGLAIPVAKPSAEVRRAIVLRSAQERGLEISNEALDALVSPDQKYAHLLETVTQLVGVLTQITSLQQSTIKLASIRKVLDRTSAGNVISPRKITSKVARYFRLKVADLTGPSRRHSVVVARGVAIYLMRKLSRNSLESIGQHLGQRDHSTILHAYRRIEETIPNDPIVRDSISEIAAQLGTHSPLD